LKTLWVEQGKDVGRHGAGAPPLSIDALYDVCETLLSHQSGPMPRLYFDPQGLLMSCGYTPDECPGCAAVSILSWSQNPIHFGRDAAQRVCTDAHGVFPPLARFEFIWATGFDCAPRADPASQHASEEALEVGATDLVDICNIDPTAWVGDLSLASSRWAISLTPADLNTVSSHSGSAGQA
jgi:hypothetical protein